MGSHGIKPDPEETLLDPKVRKTDSGLVARESLPVNRTIMAEMPLFYCNFSKFKNLPQKIDRSSTVTRVAYDLLRSRIGGMRILRYLSKRGGDNTIYLVVTTQDRDALTYMRRHFKGIRQETLIRLVDTIELSATWHVTPIMRVVSGMGLYEVASGLDRSCEPNARIHIDPKDGKASLVTIRTLKPGERITVSGSEEARWHSSKIARARTLITGDPDCRCSRCRNVRDYDRKIMKAMHLDQSRMPEYMRGAPLEDILDILDEHLNLTHFGLFAAEEIWTHLRAHEATCPLVRIRFQRKYINFLLQMPIHERRLMEASGPPLIKKHHQCSACDQTVGPEGIADEYERSIRELENLGYLGLKRLEVERLRLQIFRAFLAMKSMENGSLEPKVLLNWKSARFLVAYSAAMCTAERLWGSFRPLTHEAIVWSETMEAIMLLGATMVTLISEGTACISICKNKEN